MTVDREAVERALVQAAERGVDPNTVIVPGGLLTDDARLLIERLGLELVETPDAPPDMMMLALIGPETV